MLSLALVKDQHWVAVREDFAWQALCHWLSVDKPAVVGGQAVQALAIRPP